MRGMASSRPLLKYFSVVQGGQEVATHALSMVELPVIDRTPALVWADPRILFDRFATRPSRV